MGYHWHEIDDYNIDPTLLAQAELKALAVVWQEQRSKLERLDAFQQFNKRLKREWAIETGLIERLYVLDRGITQLLIDHGINAALIPHGALKNPNAVVSMIKDHEAVVEGIFAFVKGERKLTTSYIKEMHALFTRHQDDPEQINSMGQLLTVPLIKGDYKRLPNNPLRPDGEIHEYCPPEHVSSEMDRLMTMHHQHSDVPPEVEAAWLHHRFTQIHPFQDGNGRVARTLATLVFVKNGWFPLVVRDKDREMYIGALEAADHGDLVPLVKYFSDLQKDEFTRALSIAQNIIQSARTKETIDAIYRYQQQRKNSLMTEWQTVHRKADYLCEKAEHQLQEVASLMRQRMNDLFTNMTFFADGAQQNDSKSHYFRSQIIETAKSLGYFANLHTHRSWARLVLKNANRSELVFSFHAIGHEFRGVLVCSAFWFQKAENENSEEIFDVKPMTDRVFQLNYHEPTDQVEERFLLWLEDCVVRTLKLWNMTAL